MQIVVKVGSNTFRMLIPVLLDSEQLTELASQVEVSNYKISYLSKSYELVEI